MAIRPSFHGETIKWIYQNRRDKTDRIKNSVYFRSLLYRLYLWTWDGPNRCSYLRNIVRSGSKYRDIVILTMFQLGTSATNQNILLRFMVKIYALPKTRPSVFLLKSSAKSFQKLFLKKKIPSYCRIRFYSSKLLLKKFLFES